MKTKDLEELMNWLKIIAEPNRLLLLERIIAGVRCNCKLGFDLDLAPNLISHHLAVLKDAGLIDATHDTQDARWIHYSINRANFDKVRQALSEFLSIERIQENNSKCPATINR